eukprot:jgi/Tetstr1/448156/TSEL_035448.t1
MSALAGCLSATVCLTEVVQAYIHSVCRSNGFLPSCQLSCEELFFPQATPAGDPISSHLSAADSLAAEDVHAVDAALPPATAAPVAAATGRRSAYMHNAARSWHRTPRRCWEQGARPG